MRLLKLAALSLFGYALYEFLRGMFHDTQVGEMAKSAANRLTQGQPQASFADAGRSQNITGPGKGVEVATVDSDGGSVRHKVGRGVVSR